MSEVDFSKEVIEPWLDEVPSNLTSAKDFNNWCDCANYRICLTASLDLFHIALDKVESRIDVDSFKTMTNLYSDLNKAIGKIRFVIDAKQ